MLYDLCLDFLAYTQAIGAAWFGVVGLSVPFIVNEMLNRSERYRGWASKLAHPTLRRVALFALLLLSVFWAGFLAWREEHQARLDSERKASIDSIYSGAILQFNLSEVNFPHSRGKLNHLEAVLKFANKGNRAATSPIFVYSLLDYREVYSIEEIDEWFKSAHLSLDKASDLSTRDHIPPGSEFGKELTSEKEINENDYKMIEEGSKNIILLAIASYYDAEDAKPNQKRNEICIIIKNNPPARATSSRSCGSHNRVVSIGRR